MIVDMRIYTCVPGKMAEWVALYEQEGWPLQQKHLGRNLGWYVTVEGHLHRVVHLWGYESQADRETRRNAMAADPAWVAFLAKANGLNALVAQENSILRPTGFSGTK